MEAKRGKLDLMTQGYDNTC
jgi:hypothetical protein